VPPEQLPENNAALLAGARGAIDPSVDDPGNVAAGSSRRCGIDTVEIARVERLLRETPAADLARLFSAQELADSGDGPGRAASLAARFAAKEACLKLFPRETALGQIEAPEFSVARDNYGAPILLCGPIAAALLARYRIRSISLSLSHDRVSASAVAVVEDDSIAVPASGKFLYRFLPIRRQVIMDNLRRVYGGRVSEEEIVRLAQAHYGHLWRLFGEFLRFRWTSKERKIAMVRIENVEAFAAALAQNKGVLILTGHFGNWEVSTIAGLNHYPQMRGRFHFVRRAIKPRWLDALVTRRFNAAGFGVFPKRGSLDAMLDSLGRGDAIVFPFDQHARPPDGIEVDFFGQPAWTFKSLAIIALATGAPVLRFEDPMAPIECENTGEAIRRNTRAYNAALEKVILRRPEQWYWVHRRWKAVADRQRRRRVPATG
jgi:phosphopantetheine--protein transferase-like protein